MAFASLSEDLTCSICLSVFTDPVILLCGHSFCRECIILSLDKQHYCPQCCTSVPTEGNYLLTNHILKSLAEKSKEAAKLKRECRDDKEDTEWFCTEHEEMFKLFCVTDQQLTCIICRDSEKHETHKFKPIKEAAASLREDLEKFMENVSADINNLEGIANTQRNEMMTTTESVVRLKTHINAQFKKMHNFLRKREKEINDQLKHKEENALKKMTERLNSVEAALSESRELKGSVASVLEIKETGKFLKTWTDDNVTKTARNNFRSKRGTFLVEKAPISLWPYESHLQLFVWKEMLQVIKPREEMLTLRNDQTSLHVSEDKQSVMLNPNPNPQQTIQSPNYYGYQVYRSCQTLPDFTHSTNEFNGQHYWEMDVGKLISWELGIKICFLKFHQNQYLICTNQCSESVTLEDIPRRIGIYLSCSSKEISFYNANKMSLIRTISLSVMPSPLLAYFRLDNTNPAHTPLTVCCY